jgi:hypothetical protein
VGETNRRPAIAAWRSSPTLRYLRDRDRVLGHPRRWLSRDPREAARDLVAELGPIEARQWLRDVWWAILRDKGSDNDGS